MSIFKCKMCGGTLEINNNETVGVCEYCGTKQTLPRLDDDKKTNLYDRANHFRRSNDFDKAMGIYEQILNEDKTDAEAYWSLVLCRYGIEYVEDPSTHKRVPTVNRAQFTSVFADEDYKSAMQYADDNQKQVYEQEAKAIDEIQKGILSISQKEKPFDIFICYKETDNTGRRTQDSVLANDLYHQLTQEGFKVFFSRITLEDKIGTAYEPYIFAALNSAKVMVVLGTKPEYFNAVWVKNEWSRYLALIKKSGGKKVLIPAYRDMDPYDLPEEFSHLQAQDMSKLGFMQDLIRGIKKIVNADSENSTVKETVVVNSGNASPLLRRVFLFLEDKNWQEADEYCEKVLDLDPENAMAYVGKLMAELQVSKEENLANCEKPFDNSNNYQKAVRFADDELKTKLVGYINAINDRDEERKRMEEERRLNALYNEALEMITKAKNRDIDYLNKAVRILMHISSYKDSEQILQNCLEKIDELKAKEIESGKNTKYNAAKKNMEDCNTVESYNKIIKSFTELDGWKDSKQQIEICKQRIEKIKEEQRQQKIKEKEEQAKHKAKIARIRKKVIIGASALATLALILVIILNTVIVPSIQSSKYEQATKYISEGKYLDARNLLVELGPYKDSLQLLNKNKISCGNRFTIAKKSDGKVVATGLNSNGQCEVSDWEDIVAVSASYNHTVGLKSDGTAIATGSGYGGKCDISSWKDIVGISGGGNFTVGLKSGGTVVAVGDNENGQCDVSDWKDIIAVSAGYNHTVGLKSDGTVIATGSDYGDKCDVSDWKDIVGISAGDSHTVGLKSDGTVVAVGDNGSGQCDVSSWKDIVEISAGSSHTVGLKSDGTVVAVGDNENGQCDVSSWKDIVEVSAGIYFTVGLKSDGTLVAIGDNEYNQWDVSDWKL